MGKNLNIYVSDDAMVSLQKKKKDGGFNLSAFVSASILRDDSVKMDNIDMINQEISQKKAQIQLLEAEISTLFLKVKEVIKINENVNKEMFDAKIRDDLIRDIENFSNNQTEDQKNEYLQGIKDGKWKSFVEYAKIKLNKKEMN